MDNKVNIIRAWKDPEYRASLSAEELAKLGQSPVISEVDQNLIQGGVGSGYIATASGDANRTGRSCETVRGIWDQICTWILPG